MYWSFSFNISPSNEYSGLISFRMDWLALLAVQGTLMMVPWGRATFPPPAGQGDLPAEVQSAQANSTFLDKGWRGLLGLSQPEAEAGLVGYSQPMAPWTTGHA